MVRGNRDAHVDHLVSKGDGGSNALGNFVLACNVCNGDEKREEHWESFLRKKAPEEVSYRMRRERIEKWIASCPELPASDAAAMASVNQEINKVIAAFDEALRKIRELKTMVTSD
jgi:hypothetical protein